MTDQEKAIVMAYTGFAMLTGEKFCIFHEYIEKLMGRPVYTHEMAIKAIDDEIKERAKEDFVRLCRQGTTKLITKTENGRAARYCENCGNKVGVYKVYNFCPNCGAEVEE